MGQLTESGLMLKRSISNRLLANFERYALVRLRNDKTQDTESAQ